MKDWLREAKLIGVSKIMFLNFSELLLYNKMPCKTRSDLPIMFQAILKKIGWDLALAVRAGFFEHLGPS